jgi:hypothetical protein
MMFHGVYGDFRWLEASGHDLGDVLRICPEAVAEKNLVITLFDGGPLELTPRQLEQGWHPLDSVVHVPTVENPATLPTGSCDEWYVFPSAPTTQEFEVFVAYPWFTLGPASSIKAQPNTRWDLKKLQRIFWLEMETLEPETYMACNGRLIFVTRNAANFSKVLRGVSASLKPQGGDNFPTPQQAS